MRELMTGEAFESKLIKAEKRAWVAFMKMCHNFLGTTKSDNYQQIIKELLPAYKVLGCNISLKIQLLENLGGVSYEHGERFNQDIMQIERCYSGKSSAASMLADFCWSIRQEIPMETMKRKKTTK
ncbi:hypothetical protein GWI33_011756 [Rhynchophorus ferrugineus]|uniref:Uncharacterized protein n=1 Tax=Rhynchophorus ferrugineus TaxID=354439 RepID=A0A834IB79_RHYFE|nr:hypothetical protein GWI33_011756 [Rhynchophorus ferrugineus]